MKKLFIKYGDRLSFDLTFNMIKKETAESNLFKIGVFLGISSTARLVPLGLVVTDSMTA